MYDDFMAGYTGKFQQIQQEKGPRGYYPTAINPQTQPSDQQKVPGVYDKSKLIRMRGPNGEEGTIYADGKMYIIFPGGKAQKRTFPSRPWGIRYMQKRGWVLV